MTAGGFGDSWQVTYRRQSISPGTIPLGNISDIPDEAAIRVAQLWRLNFKLKYILGISITCIQECSRRAYRHMFYACDR
jgi:hypothetical protein